MACDTTEVKLRAHRPLGDRRRAEKRGTLRCENERGYAARQSQRGNETDMKLRIQRSLHAALWLSACVVWMWVGGAASAQGVNTTTVQGTVYLADGQAGSGTLQISWPAFTTANNQAVAAGRTSVKIGADGYVSVNLAPNLGSTPAGLFYTAVYHLSDGTTSTEYWVIPAAAQASVSQVRAQVMPAAQAVQAVSKGYVDQSIQELTQSLLTASGGSLSGPLYLNGDPTQPTQASTKRYVDTQFAKALPLSGGVLSGPLTGVQLGAAYQVDQFPGADFGEKLQACLNGLDGTYGGTCDARNFKGNLAIGSAIAMSTANATVQLPCATIATANSIQISAGTRNVTLHGCAQRGASNASGSQGGTVLLYSGTGVMIQVGDPTYSTDTLGFHVDNVVINTTASNSASAQGMAAYRTQELDLDGLYLLGNSNQTGITLDGTGNYTGGTFQDVQLGGFGTAVNGIGHQTANSATTDWVNASTFLRLHINCPTSGGSPIAGTYGINLQQGDGNTFTGGDIEGCSTALHLGPNAQNNTIVGLRNENSNNQVIAEVGSSYNNWITGGTMFTGQLTDHGTRNSFLDTFHRSFNGLNGDWYGSQQDATVTNHFRIGIGSGNERGLLNRYQTDLGYRWTTGLSDAAAGEQFYQVLDELNNVYRLSIGQYNNGQSSTNNQTVINAAGSGAVVLNGSANAGTGGVLFGSGGGAGATVASINNQGNAQFNGSLTVGGASTFTNSTTVRNQADAEVDSFLWAGSTANQKESYIYKDYTGASQWYMVKDTSNNWALNSAPGGLDSFKAYQSSNSGDTYINASNSSGHIRLNYESGAGAETDIYSGGGSNLVAGFLGTTAIKFPGLAASSGRNCVQIDNSGYITNTGSPCGSGGTNGTVYTGATGQLAYYVGNGTVLGGMGSVGVSAGGTGATTAAQALANLGGQPALPGVATDGNSGLTVPGSVTAKSMNASMNKVLNVMGPPYNAYGDAMMLSRAVTINTSGVTSGYTFSASDATAPAKRLNAVCNGPDGWAATAYSGTIISVSSGNATLSPVPTSTCNTTHWVYGHDDHGSDTLGSHGSGIQQAFTDAWAQGASLYFPAGTYLTSTINFYGQSFSGASVSRTTVIGEPGMDVFLIPDGSPLEQGAKFRDISILVDESINVSASPANGNIPPGTGAIPYRITGTKTGNTPLDASNGGPAKPGPVSICGGAVLAAGATTVVTGGSGCGQSGDFTFINSQMIIGQPITILGAGDGGTDYNGTIASVVSQTTVTVTPPTSTAVASVQGHYGNPPIGPNGQWWIGNCGIAIPSTDALHVSQAMIGWSFQNVNFGTASWAQTPYENHTCGFFVNGNSGLNDWNDVDFVHLYAGKIEAPAALNNPNGVTATPDTDSYRNINYKFVYLPFVTYNGTHRRYSGISIYEANEPFYLGGFGFVNGGYSGWSITEYYDECWSQNTGEHSRWSGAGDVMAGGFMQCAATFGTNAVNLRYMDMTGLYTNFVGGRSRIRGGFSGLAINGDGNTFDGTGLTSNNILDNGYNNKVSTIYGSSGSFVSVGQPKRQDMGSLDASFLLTGNSGTPYANGNDMLWSCADYYWSTLNSLCVNDPSGAEVTKSYLHYGASSGAGSMNGAWYDNGKMQVGRDIPQSKLYLISQGRCAGASGSCSTILKIQNASAGNASVVNCGITFGSTWTIQGAPGTSSACLVDTTSLPIGSQLVWVANVFSGTPTTVDIAFVGFEVLNTDAINAAVTQANTNAQAMINKTVQYATAGAPVLYTAQNWTFGSAAVVDSTSPVGYSSAQANANALSAANGISGSTALFSAPQIPAGIEDLITISTASTGNPMDTLNGAITNSQTSITVNAGATSAYPTNGYLLIDQELVQYSGTPTGGQTTYAVTRGVSGTVPQSHADGVAVALVPHGQFNISCNSQTLSVPVVFEPSWTYWSAQVPLGTCNGYPITNRWVLDTVGGTTSKVATMTIASMGTAQVKTPVATGVVPVSAAQGNGFEYTANKPLAGSGAGLATTATSGITSGHPACYSTASGDLRDCGATLPVAPLSGTSGSIGGSALTAGGCASGTATITGATTSMVPKASPNTYPGDGMVWEAYMSAANTVTVKVCAVAAGTPTASTYNVRVLQ